MNRDKAPTDDVTQLLMAWAGGNPSAMEELMPLVYEELRRRARSYLRRERGDHTLQPTALIHEAYVRMVDQRVAHWHSRAQFFGVAAQLMRRILIDHARGRARAKRGGAAQRISLDNVADIPEQQDVDVVELDQALVRLSELEPRQSRVVELRYFGGLSIEETGEALGISAATVKREWSMAKAWLHRELHGSIRGQG